MAEVKKKKPKKVKKNIKSSKVTLAYANTGKLKDLSTFIDEYTSLVSQFVDILWPLDKVPEFITTELTKDIETKLSARVIQCAGKQASGIVRGTQKKQKQRLFVINRLIKEGCFKKARRLQKRYDENIAGKPKITHVNPELDSRFVDIGFKDTGHFDGWVTLSSLKKDFKLELPFNKHKHFNKMAVEGAIKGGLRISKDSITFLFERPEVTKKTEGKVLAIDIGQTTCLTASNGQVVNKDKHGHTMKSICDKMVLKKYGSKAFFAAQRHRDNYMHWAVKQLKLDQYKTVMIEDIKHMYKGRNVSKSLKRWVYAPQLEMLETWFTEFGVQTVKQNPAYRSQRCYVCSWTRKKNRKGKLFVCDHCGHCNDADLNAALNLTLNLSNITRKERLLRRNVKGFFWEVRQSNIVAAVQKTEDVEKVQLVE